MRGGKIYTALLREETAARPRIRVQFAWDQSLWRRPPKFGNKRTAVEPDICDGYYTSSLPSIALRGSARDVGLLSLRPKAGGFWTNQKLPTPNRATWTPFGWFGWLGAGEIKLCGGGTVSW